MAVCERAPEQSSQISAAERGARATSKAEQSRAEQSRAEHSTSEHSRAHERTEGVNHEREEHEGLNLRDLRLTGQCAAQNHRACGVGGEVRCAKERTRGKG